MSGHELRRIEVLSEVLARRRTEVSAAAILGLSTRQTRRLVVAYRDGGGGAMIHKARGRTSNNQLHAGIRPSMSPALARSPRFPLRRWNTVNVENTCKCRATQPGTGARLQFGH